MRQFVALLWMFLCTSAGAWAATLFIPVVLLVAVSLRAIGFNNLPPSSLVFGFLVGVGQGLGAGCGAVLAAGGRNGWKRWAAITGRAALLAGIVGALAYLILMSSFPTQSIQGPFWWDHPASLCALAVAVLTWNVSALRGHETKLDRIARAERGATA